MRPNPTAGPRPQRGAGRVAPGGHHRELRRVRPPAQSLVAQRDARDRRPLVRQLLHRHPPQRFALEHRFNVLQRIDTTLTMLRQRAEHLEEHVQGGGQEGARQRGVDIGRPRVLKQAPQEARLAER